MPVTGKLDAPYVCFTHSLQGVTLYPFYCALTQAHTAKLDK